MKIYTQIKPFAQKSPVTQELISQNYTRNNKSIRENHEKNSLKTQNSGEELSISPRAKMINTLEGLKAARQNVKYGLTMFEITDNSFEAMQRIIQRVHALAMQAADEEYPARQKLNLQVEVSLLVDEIDRLASFSEFNGIELIQGDFAPGSMTASLWIQTGPDFNERQRFYIPTSTARKFNLKALDGSILSIFNPNDPLDHQASKEAIEVTDEAFEKLQKSRAQMQEYQNSLQKTKESLDLKIEALQNRLKDHNPPEHSTEGIKQ